MRPGNIPPSHRASGLRRTRGVWGAHQPTEAPSRPPAGGGDDLLPLLCHPHAGDTPTFCAAGLLHYDKPGLVTVPLHSLPGLLLPGPAAATSRGPSMRGPRLRQDAGPLHAVRDLQSQGGCLGGSIGGASAFSSDQAPRVLGSSPGSHSLLGGELASPSDPRPPPILSLSLSNNIFKITIIKFQ